MWLHSQGFPKSHNPKEFPGTGTALKPAHEPIVLARKPMIGTLVENIKAHGTGGLNIDSCRVPGEPWIFGQQADMRGGNFGTNRPSEGHVHATNVEGGKDGRWPANVLHDGSDDVTKLFPESAGQQGDVTGEEPSKGMGTYGIYGTMDRGGFQARKDAGNASRFFYCPKATTVDREEGTEDLDTVVLARSNKAQAAERRGEHTEDGKGGMNKTHLRRNNHPTVKPVELMRYLVRLITPRGGTVLDPFMGSGSTGKAAILEGCNFIGIDREERFVRIAEARCKWAQKNVDRQINLFDV